MHTCQRSLQSYCGMISMKPTIFGSSHAKAPFVDYSSTYETGFSREVLLRSKDLLRIFGGGSMWWALSKEDTWLLQYGRLRPKKLR